MKSRVWVTLTSLEKNFKPYGISFSNGYSFDEIKELMHLRDRTPNDVERIIELSKMINRIRFRYLNFTDIGQVPISLHLGLADQMPMRNFSMCRILDSFIILSEATANILANFNLGTSRIHAVKFKDAENGKLYYLLNVCECRRYIIKEKCENGNFDSIKSTTGGMQLHLKRSFHKDFNVAVSTSAGNNALDLWHDPELKYSIFISERLRKALESKGLSQDWCMKECKVISSE